MPIDADTVESLRDEPAVLHDYLLDNGFAESDADALSDCLSNTLLPAREWNLPLDIDYEMFFDADAGMNELGDYRGAKEAVEQELSTVLGHPVAVRDVERSVVEEDYTSWTCTFTGSFRDWKLAEDHRRNL